MIDKLMCRIFGHKRGKRLLTATKFSPVNTFACPRCKATWDRKAKA